MGLINCKNKRTNCGTPYPSTCVSYEGSFTGVLNKDDFSCDVNLDDILEKLSSLLKSLQDSLVITNSKVAVNSADILTIKSQIATIQTQLSNLDAANVFVEMDLGCLTSDASPCAVGINKYSVKSLLMLFKNEICLLKS